MTPGPEGTGNQKMKRGGRLFTGKGEGEDAASRASAGGQNPLTKKRKAAATYLKQTGIVPSLEKIRGGWCPEKKNTSEKHPGPKKGEHACKRREVKGTCPGERSKGKHPGAKGANTKEASPKGKETKKRKGSREGIDKRKNCPGQQHWWDQAIKKKTKGRTSTPK